MLLLLVLLSSLAGASQPDNAAAKSQKAAQAMSDGRFDEAARIYRELVAVMPGDAKMLANLGMALAMGGKEAQALEPLQKAARLDPKLLPAQMFLGTSYLALGKPELAVPPLERVVALSPNDAEALGTLAEAYLATGKPGEAVERFRKLTALAPREPGAWFGLGQAYNAMAQEGLATFEREPAGSPWQQLLLADALEADKRFPEAFTVYRQVLEKLPRRAIHDALARIYEQTGHKDWAAAQRAKAAAVPEDCVAQKAECEFRAGRLRSALAAASRGQDPESRYWRTRAASELAREAFAQLDKLPDSRERREFRAELARSERRHQDAVAEVTAALKFAPGDPRLLADLATACFFARDYDRALATVKPLVEAHPGEPSLLALLGETLLQLQRLDEALPVLQKAARIDASNPAVQLALGRAYVQSGNFAAAIPLLEPQLASDEDGSLHMQLARAYQGAGQAGKAGPVLEKGRALQQAFQERSAASSEGKITPP